MLKVFQKACSQLLSLDAKLLGVSCNRSIRLKWRKDEEKEVKSGELPSVYGGVEYRRKKIPDVTLEQSMEYFSSAAYRKAYGTDKVWVRYRRNYKGNIMPKPRYTCKHKGVFLTNNPCPVCRDIYFVVDHRHIELLKQFLDTNTVHVADNMKTGVCNKQQRNLIRATERAIEEGFMEGPVTFRGYNMEYYRSLLNQTEEEEKTDVPFKILNQELLPYNIIKKYSQAKREERREKLKEERENTKI